MSSGSPFFDAGADAVDADALGGIVFGQNLRQHIERSFGGVVGVAADGGLEARNRADVQDIAMTL